MKKFFQKILISVVCAVLAMPAWAKGGDISVKALDAVTKKGIVGIEVQIHNNKGEHLDSPDIQKFNNAKYKTGGNGSLKMPGWCSILHVAKFNIELTDPSGNYNGGTYITNPEHNKTVCSDVVVLLTSKMSEAERQKQDDIKNCATPENDSSISAITKCVNWGNNKSTWKTEGCATSDKNAVATCKAVSQSDSGYQAKKKCWIIVGGKSRVFLPAPSNGNIYRCTVTGCKGDYELKGGRCQKKAATPVVTDPTNGTASSTTPVVTDPNGTASSTTPVVTDPNGTASSTTPVVTDPNGTAPGTTPVVTDPNGILPSAPVAPVTPVQTSDPTVPAVTDPGANVVVTPIVAVTPKVATMTGDTIIKSLAVRLALDNDASSQMDKNKFADLLGAADNISIREILIACIKSMPADIACNQCEAFIRSMVNYHNNN